MKTRKQIIRQRRQRLNTARLKREQPLLEMKRYLRRNHKAIERIIMADVAKHVNLRLDEAERGIQNWQFTVLKYRLNNETKPLSLFDLRLRIEAGEDLPKMEWGGCGCGG